MKCTKYNFYIHLLQLGPNSGLHIIIFDEIDAICKARGSTGSNTGVHDTVVNQLLAKIDGVEQLNNILVIGMTNRRDMIDEALMRPGRLEVWDQAFVIFIRILYNFAIHFVVARIPAKWTDISIICPKSSKSVVDIFVFLPLEETTQTDVSTFGRVQEGLIQMGLVW